MANRQVFAFLRRLTPNQCCPFLIGILGGGGLLSAAATDSLSRGLDVLAVGLLKFGDDVTLLVSIERSDTGVGELYVLSDRAEPCESQGLTGDGAVYTSRFELKSKG